MYDTTWLDAGWAVSFLAAVVFTLIDTAGMFLGYWGARAPTFYIALTFLVLTLVIGRISNSPYV